MPKVEETPEKRQEKEKKDLDLIERLKQISSEDPNAAPPKKPRRPTKGIDETFDLVNQKSSNYIKATKSSEKVFSEVTSFEGLDLHPRLVAAIKDKLGLEVPTMVQRECAPILMTGQDALVQARTGSGKTLAFLLPILHQLVSHQERQMGGSGGASTMEASFGDRMIGRADGTLCIIISPTRELSIQTYEVLERLVQPFPWIVPGLIMGGETKKKEKARLRKGISILVATPGRLLDHLNNTRSMVTNHLQFLVLDEADRLLELGFEKYLFEIITQLTDRAIKRIRRQNLLISATLPDRVKKLATTSLRNPMFISVIGSKGSVSTVESALLHDRTPEKPQRNGKKNKVTEEELVDEEEDLLLREKLARFKRESATNAIKSKDREGAGDNEESNEGDEGLGDHEIKGRDGYTFDEDDMSSFVNTPKKLVQTFVQVPCKRRLAALYGFLQTKVFLHAPNLPAYLRPFKPKKIEHCKVIVFVSTTAEVEFIYNLFSTTQFFLKHVDTSVDGDEDDDEFLTQPLEKPPKSPFFSPSRLSSKKKKSSPDDAAAGDDAPALDDQDDEDQDDDTPVNDPKKGEAKEEKEVTVLWKLHGNMEQKDRTQSFQEFRHAPHGALICTDVAARGLDVPDVHWIVQWDPAIRIKEYIHRIGRTARMEGRGNALTFLTPSEYQYLTILQDHGMTLHRIDADVLLNEIRVPNMRTTDPPAFVMLQKKFEALIDEDKKMQKLARESFRSFVRSYATYPKSLKHVFHIKNLHLGHVAKSFALKQAPSSLLSTSSERANSARQFRPDLAKTKSPRVHSDPSTHSKKPELSDFKHTMEGLSRFKRLTVDEYGSGF